jgi:hypothetical protein
VLIDVHVGISRVPPPPLVSAYYVCLASLMSAFTCALPYSCLLTTCALPHTCLLITCALPYSCLLIICALPYSCLLTTCALPHSCLLITCALSCSFHSFHRADSWSYKVASVASALGRWAEQNDRNPKRTYVWICSLCLNQHRIIKTVTPDELAAEFGPRVQHIGRILPMLEP